MSLNRIQQLHTAAGEFVHHIAVGLQNLSQPLLQQLSLRLIPPMANQLHPAAQLTDGDRRQKQRGAPCGPR